MVKPFIIGTRNARDMIHLGAEILREGGSAMDVVEAAVNAVEDNPLDSGVRARKGELAIRLSSARMIVSYLENGLTLRGAVRKVLKDVYSLQDGTISCLVFDREGNTISGSMTGESIHYYMDVDSEGPEERKGVWVKP